MGETFRPSGYTTFHSSHRSISCCRSAAIVRGAGRDGSGRDGTSARRYPNTVLLGPDSTRGTTFVCGFLGCDVRPYNPLISSLPKRMHVSGIAGGWLSQIPRQVVAESRDGRMGSETMLTRLAELMFVEVVRRYIEQLAERIGGIAGVFGTALSGGIMLALLKERRVR